MKKAEIVEYVSRRSEISRNRASRAIQALVGCIQRAVSEGNRITITGLGTFRSKPRKGRIGRNLRTGEAVKVPPGRKVSFKPSAMLRSYLYPRASARPAKPAVVEQVH